MKTFFIKYRLPALLLTVISFSACRQDDFADIPMEEETALLSVTAHIGRAMAPQQGERAVKTLRLLVFNQSGNIILNKLYTDVTDLLLPADGTYSIRERLPRNSGDIRICLVANERSRWRLGRSANDATPLNYSLLKNKYIDFADDYASEGFVTLAPETVLNVSPGEGNFVMFGEESARMQENGVALSKALELERLVAKVSLVLSYDPDAVLATSAASRAGATFRLTSAVIENQPLESYLTARAYEDTENKFLSTSSQELRMNYEVDKGLFFSEPLTFYVPEHLLSTAHFAGELYTYIQVLGVYSPDGVVEIPVGYKIPLGDGVQQLFDTPAYTPLKEDYAVSRNHHYQVDGRVKKLGEFDGIALQLSIKQWGTGEDINIEHPAPYLNVSEMAPTFHVGREEVIPVGQEHVDHIYFWTNQPGTTVAINDVSFGYYPDELATVPQETDLYFGTLKCDLLLNLPSDSGFTEQNGRVKIAFSNAAELPLGSLLRLSFMLNANGLKRRINVKYLFPVVRANE